METKYLKINPADNVVVAISDLKAGETITVDGHVITLKEDVPAGHKVTLKDFAQGENIIKSWGNGSGFVPSGWTVADNGSQVYAGNKSRGPRIMNFSGDFKNAFYVRSVSADKAGYIEYGNTNGYTCLWYMASMS